MYIFHLYFFVGVNHCILDFTFKFLNHFCECLFVYVCVYVLTWLEGKVIHTKLILCILLLYLKWALSLELPWLTSLENLLSLHFVYHFVGGCPYIFFPIVCLGLFQQLLNWMLLKITFIKNFETSFSQVRSWILLRSQWLARVTVQRLIVSALCRPYSFTFQLEGTTVSINSLEQKKTTLSRNFLFFFSTYFTKCITSWVGKGDTKIQSLGVFHF